MKVIELPTKDVVKVCDCHYDLVKDRTWFICNGYARCNNTKSYKRDYMHRVIRPSDKGELVDHINLDRLDNRCSNLRLVTPSQNLMNRKATSKSGYKGVTWSKNERKYTASYKLKGIRHHLGYFIDPIEAAKAYDNAALKVFGEFARGNFI